jgi:hypothetical protein
MTCNARRGGFKHIFRSHQSLNLQRPVQKTIPESRKSALLISEISADLISINRKSSFPRKACHVQNQGGLESKRIGIRAVWIPGLRPE